MLPYYSSVSSPVVSVDYFMLNDILYGPDNEPYLGFNDINYLGLPVTIFTANISKE